jgi:hypothetical protein
MAGDTNHAGAEPSFVRHIRLAMNISARDRFACCREMLAQRKVGKAATISEQRFFCILGECIGKRPRLNVLVKSKTPRSASLTSGAGARTKRTFE